MKRSLFLLFIFILPLIATPQEEENNFGIKFSGFVKNDFIFDSRQTYASREGHFLLWPVAESLDAENNDINAKPNFNLLAIQTRLKGTISGPDAFGAKTSGLIEGAFFGHSNSDVNGFRLRHAFGKLRWESTELLFGQFWHPMFVTSCFPGTVSFNTGAPFQPFSRTPQIRFTKYFGSMQFGITALSHRDFVTSGGSSELRNSAIPEMHFQLAYHKKNADAGTETVAGFGGGYKTLVPRLVTDSLLVADESVGSYITEAYLKFKLPAITVKLEGVYGQNTYDILGISSYALESIDTATDNRTYTALNSMSFWLDLHTNGKKFQAGLFAGYTNNMGAGKDILACYGTRSNIEYIYRVSPRFIFNSGKTRFAFELEYTTAAFGTIDTDGSVIDSKAVSNIRFLFGAYYFF